MHGANINAMHHKRLTEKYNMAKGFIELQGIIATIHHGYKHAVNRYMSTKHPKTY
jgi:hypothetical protein